jgi:hypothetical protein
MASSIDLKDSVEIELSKDGSKQQKRVVYMRFPVFEFLCDECLAHDSEKASSKLLNRDMISTVVRNDCQADLLSLPSCGCICVDKFGRQCRCHETYLCEYRGTRRICYCCQICRYISTPLMNFAELGSLEAAGRINKSEYASCSRCKRYVYHQYDDNEGIKCSHHDFFTLHFLVEQKQFHKCSFAQ